MRALVVVIPALLATGAAAAPLLPAAPLPHQETAPDLGRDLAAFVDALGRWRQGDPAAGVELEALGARLADQHGRADARAVAAFHLALDPDARLQGLRDEARFAELYGRVHAAGWTGSVGPTGWPGLRDELLDELEALAREVEPRPDFTPAARARSLASHLAVARARRDPNLDSVGRERSLARAADDARAAIALFERAGQRTPQLEPRWVLAEVAAARLERELAARTYREVVERAHEAGQAGYVERGLVGLIELAREGGDPASVERLLGEAARAIDLGSSWPLVRERALYLFHCDRAGAALELLEAHPPEASGHRREWSGLVSASRARLGDLEGARAVLAEIPDLSGEAGALAAARLSAAEGQLEAVLELLEGWRDYSDVGRAQALATIGDALLDADRPAEAAEALALALDAARAYEASLDRTQGSVFGEWLGVQAVVQLARARARSGDPLGAAVALEAGLGRTLRAGPEPDGLDLTRWAANAGAGMLIAAVGADDGIIVHVDTTGDALAVDLPHGRRAAERAVRRLREAVQANDDARTARLAGDWSASLFPPPISERLERAPEGARLLLVLHGGLEGLPESTLRLGDRALDEALVPAVLPGLPSASPRPPATEPRRWTLLGAPLDPGQRPALPGAARELAHLARRHPQAPLRTGSAFTHAALLDALATSDNLHVATHLLSDDRCGGGALSPVGLLVTGGGVVCAEDVRREARGRELVVLAACATGAGRRVDAEGLFGLGRAFLTSGTRNLVVTLWPVEDGAARTFAEALHAALADGAPPASAVRAGREALREGGFGSAEAAAFRLLGPGD